MRLQLVFLGTGGAWGTPRLGCSCPACRRLRPWNFHDPDFRTRSSLLLVFDPDEPRPRRYVVDTTPDFRFQALREDLQDLDGVLVTHVHSDHVMGFDDLFPMIRQREREHRPPVTLRAHPAVLAELREHFGYAFPKLAVRPLELQHLVPLWPGAPWRVSPFRVPHGRVFTTGFLFVSDARRVAYISDFGRRGKAPIPETVLPFLEALDLLVLDGTDLLRDERPHHAPFSTSKTLVERLAPKRVVFTHVGHALEGAPPLVHADAARQLAVELPNADLARDGMVVDFPD